MPKISEAPIPDKPQKGAWLRRFTSIVESQLRGSQGVRPRQAGKVAAQQLRSEWRERFPDVDMPADWIAAP